MNRKSVEKTHFLVENNHTENVEKSVWVKSTLYSLVLKIINGKRVQMTRNLTRSENIIGIFSNINPSYSSGDSLTVGVEP